MCPKPLVLCRGVFLGDSWIAPVDFTQAWLPYLEALSLLDGAALTQLQSVADSAKVRPCLCVSICVFNCPLISTVLSGMQCWALSLCSVRVDSVSTLKSFSCNTTYPICSGVCAQPVVCRAHTLLATLSASADHSSGGAARRGHTLRPLRIDDTSELVDVVSDRQVQSAVAGGQLAKATELWAALEEGISNATDNVDWYNVLRHNTGDDDSSALLGAAGAHHPPLRIGPSKMSLAESRVPHALEGPMTPCDRFSSRICSSAPASLAWCGLRYIR